MTGIPPVWPAFEWDVLHDWTLTNPDGSIVARARDENDILLYGETYLIEDDGLTHVMATRRIDWRRYEDREALLAHLGLAACRVLHRAVEERVGGEG